MTETTYSRQKIFRKKLVMPTEHGAWAWLLIPFVVGAVVASKISSFGERAALSLLLTFIGGLCAFLMRQPATVWLRARQGKARRTDEPLAAGWTLGFAILGGLCLLGLLALGRTALLWLLFPLVAILGLYLVAALKGRAERRALWMELAGAVGLALMAPAAFVAATERLVGTIWALWVIMAVQNALSVFYVRLRLADTHGRPANRVPVFWIHLLGTGAVLVIGLMSLAPLLSVVPFIGFLGRGVWVVRHPRLVHDVRRFGFTELGIESLAGLWIAASYWIS
jgi:hypothetical protein